MCANHASRHCECCGPALMPPPCGVRTTSGTEACPPNMKRALAAWLTRASMASVMKSMNMISSTGLRPDSAAPTAALAMAASEIGVSRMRSGPKRACRPRVTPNGPPASATSSPKTNTAGSSSMHSASARLIAWAKRSSAISANLCVGIDIVAGGLPSRRPALAGALDGLLDLCLDRFAHVPALRLAHALLVQHGFEARHGIVFAQPLHLVAGPVLLRIALVVAAPAMGDALQHPRALPGTNRLDRAARCIDHRQNIVAVDFLVRDREGRRQFFQRRHELLVGRR